MDTKWNGMDKDPGEDLEYYVAARVDEALNGAEDAPGVIRVEPKKHPRLRAWTGVVSLLLGFALTAGSLLSGLGQWVTGSDLEWWKGDWQETRTFASEVSGYVRDFLTLGAGGELDWYDTVLEGIVWETDGGWWKYPTSTTATAMEDPGYTEPDAAYQSDKNVLYCIRRDNRTLYANTDQALAYAKRYGLAMTAGSDGHDAREMRGGGMRFATELNTIEDFIRAVRTRQPFEILRGKKKDS